MLPDVWLGREFFSSLTALDEEIARRVAAEGCQHCGGPLHQSNYERKPRGGLVAEAGEAFSLRHSLCCGREGCRKRTLPPSLRFLGRRVYLEGVVLLASMVLQARAVLREAQAQTGVPSWTLRRWGRWWSESFPLGRTWREPPPAPDAAQLPGSLLRRLERELTGGQTLTATAEVCRMASLLLAPATTESVKEGSRFVRGLGPMLPVKELTQKM